MNKKLILLCLLPLLLLCSSPARADSPYTQSIEYVRGVVVSVIPLTSSNENSRKTAGEIVKIDLVTGPEAGKTVNSINYVSGNAAFDIKVNPGDKIIVAVTNDPDNITYHVSDFDRMNYIYMLLGIFAAQLIIFGGLVGVKSLFMIGFSCVLIFKVLIGQILSGSMDIALLVLLISAAIATVSQTVISGWTIKTRAAILGTVGGVAIAGILSKVAILLMHLTGLESEEAMMLHAAKLMSVDFQGVLFAGMVLGALGAVMDVTISISSALYEVKKLHPTAGVKEMFWTGMNVGRDIMGTMSNTLILAYTGTSLPLLLLITSQPNVPMIKIMNMNMIVTEIARALTGSIGLVFAIPLTALIAAVLMKNKEIQEDTENQEAE